MTLCEKILAKEKLDTDKQPELRRLKEQISRLKSTIKSCNKETDKTKDVNKKHLDVTKRLHSALVDVTRAIEELNEQGQNKSVKLQLADDQVQEYHKMAKYQTSKQRVDEIYIHNYENSKLTSMKVSGMFDSQKLLGVLRGYSLESLVI